MTDKLSKLISEVLELDEKATKAPWSPTIAFVEGESYSTLFLNGKETTEENAFTTADRDLIRNYRTSAPKLAKVCEELVKALDYCATEPGFLHPQNNAQFAVAKAALAEVERILSE